MAYACPGGPRPTRADGADRGVCTWRVGGAASRGIEPVGGVSRPGDVLDEDHLAGVTPRAESQPTAGERLVAIPIVHHDRDVIRRLGVGRCPEQLAALDEPLAAVPVPQQAVVANPVKPRRQDMEQEPADEFRRVERHRLGRGGCAIVRVAEAHEAVSDVEEALVGEGDAMRVAADVELVGVEHLL